MKTILHSTKRKKFLTLSLLMVMMILTFAPLSAFATDVTISTSDDVFLKGALKKATGAESGVPNGDVTNPFGVVLKPEAKELNPNLKEYLIEYNSSNRTLTFHEDTFENATDASRKDALAAFVTMLQESNVSNQTQQDIIDRMQTTNKDVKALLIPIMMDSTSADVFTALRFVAPALPIIRVIFGVGAIAIILLLFASTIADLVFIGLPLMRERLQNNADSKGKAKIPFISPDALSVVKEVESGLDSAGGYQNAYLLYFKRRVWTYVIISICILYLVIGELGGLMAWLMSLGSGVVN